MPIFKFFLLLTCLFTHIDAKAFVDPELTQLLQTEPEREISLILVFKTPKTSVVSQFADLSPQKRKMQVSNLAQSKFIEEFAGSGFMKQSSIKSFWINNSINLITSVPAI